jgi:hypothetical protein
VTEPERKHLIETDRHIAECEAYIAKQRDLIERAIQQGRSTEVAEETLESLEASLREPARSARLMTSLLMAQACPSSGLRLISSHSSLSPIIAHRTFVELDGSVRLRIISTAVLTASSRLSV